MLDSQRSEATSFTSVPSGVVGVSAFCLRLVLLFRFEDTSRRRDSGSLQQADHLKSLRPNESPNVMMQRVSRHQCEWWRLVGLSSLPS
jgi:hypothetical protein